MHLLLCLVALEHFQDGFEAARLHTMAESSLASQSSSEPEDSDGFLQAEIAPLLRQLCLLVGGCVTILRCSRGPSTSGPAVDGHPQHMRQGVTWVKEVWLCSFSLHLRACVCVV